MRKLTLDEMAARSRLRYGDKYTYVGTHVKGKSTVVLELTCNFHPERGVFLADWSNHMKAGGGCKSCAAQATSDRRSLTLEEVVKRSHMANHNSDLQHLKIEVVSGESFVTVLCPGHGEFTVLAMNHLKSPTGCPKCSTTLAGVNCRISRSDIDAHRLNNPDSYGKGYGLVMEGVHTLINLTCSVHGEFSRKASAFLDGAGCPDCTKEKNTKNLEDFQREGELVQGDKYVYIGVESESVLGSLVSYRKLRLVCPNHGGFSTHAYGHISKARKIGCPTCADDSQSKSLAMEESTFLEKARAQHGETYLPYRIFRGFRGKSEVEATCQQHGTFQLSASDHCRGQGCPKCSSGGLSKLGAEFLAFLQVLDSSIVGEYGIEGSRLRWDAYAPNQKVAFEFHGLYWHSEEYKDKNYHYAKHLLGLSNGFRTIHIFEDEWLDKRSIVESLVMVALQMRPHKTYARQTEVVELARKEAGTFLSTYHIQGDTTSSSYSGLRTENGTLVAVMAYANRESGRGKTRSDEQLEITRYASSVSVLGGFSKLLSHLKKAQPDLKHIYTFSDRRLFSGELYTKMGFTPVAMLPSDYFYVKNGKRVHKSLLQKSNFKSNKSLVFEEGKTERELASLNNFFRVYDCGKVKWSLKL